MSLTKHERTSFHVSILNFQFDINSSVVCLNEWKFLRLRKIQFIDIWLNGHCQNSFSHRHSLPQFLKLYFFNTFEWLKGIKFHIALYSESLWYIKAGKQGKRQIDIPWRHFSIFVSHLAKKKKAEKYVEREQRNKCT